MRSLAKLVNAMRPFPISGTASAIAPAPSAITAEAHPANANRRRTTETVVAARTIARHARSGQHRLLVVRSHCGGHRRGRRAGERGLRTAAPGLAARGCDRVRNV